MYNASGQLNKANKEKSVAQFMPLVKRIAYYLMARLPANVLVEDLIQNGTIGLLEALERFSDEGGAMFETYASHRIRGAMLDGLRENDWLPRTLRHDYRRIEQTVAQLEQELGRHASETELAQSMDMDLAEFQRTIQEAKGHQIISYEDLVEEEHSDFLDHYLSDESQNPLKILEDEALRKVVVAAVADLPEREKLAMALYYEQDLNLREIGEVMGVSESRVSQLHSQAVVRIRACVFGNAKKKRRDRKKEAADKEAADKEAADKNEAKMGAMNG